MIISSKMTRAKQFRKNLNLFYHKYYQYYTNNLRNWSNGLLLIFGPMEIKSLDDCLHHRSMFLTTNWRHISRRDCIHFTWGISNANQQLIRVRSLAKGHTKTNNSKCYTCIGYGLRSTRSPVVRVRIRMRRTM
jgi:hypothetical protein